MTHLQQTKKGENPTTFPTDHSPSVSAYITGPLARKTNIWMRSPKKWWTKLKIKSNREIFLHLHTYLSLSVCLSIKTRLAVHFAIHNMLLCLFMLLMFWTICYNVDLKSVCNDVYAEGERVGKRSRREEKKTTVYKQSFLLFFHLSPLAIVRLLNHRFWL
jgi:hypothetical protein